MDRIVFSTSCKWTTIALTPAEVNLYDMAKYVIYPSTERDQCSVVELMADGAQPPDYFVAHWCGEALLGLLRCLVHHAYERGLELDADSAVMKAELEKVKKEAKAIKSENLAWRVPWEYCFCC